VPARVDRLFAALLLAQAAHSVEEYAFRLYDVLPPARLLSRLVSADPARGFLVINVTLVAVFAWCWWARVRPRYPSARGIVWFWTVLEGANGVGHLVLAAATGGYFPGAATAPVLLVLAGALGVTLRRTRWE
jgi:uncharacterized protein with HXXEE motif